MRWIKTDFVKWKLHPLGKIMVTINKKVIANCSVLDIVYTPTRHHNLCTLIFCLTTYRSNTSCIWTERWRWMWIMRCISDDTGPYSLGLNQFLFHMLSLLHSICLYICTCAYIIVCIFTSLSSCMLALNMCICKHAYQCLLMSFSILAWVCLCGPLPSLSFLRIFLIWWCYPTSSQISSSAYLP